jgi:hypothetical protein
VVVELVVVELVAKAVVVTAVALVPEQAVVVEQQLHHIKVQSLRLRLHLHHPHVPEHLCDLDLQEVL